jgi:hypothetical protein
MWSGRVEKAWGESGAGDAQENERSVWLHVKFEDHGEYNATAESVRPAVPATPEK